jgi:HlyD family secretion protein
MKTLTGQGLSTECCSWTPGGIPISSRVVRPSIRRYGCLVLNFLPQRFCVRASPLLFCATLTALLLMACSKAETPDTVSGTIETDEVHVASRYGGRVEKISVAEGDSLKPGELLAELEATELQARREQAEAVLAELTAGARPEELATAKAEWEAQQAQLKFAQAERKRAEELFRQQTIAAAERDLTVSRAESLEKTVAAAKSRYDLLVAGTRPERILQARADLAAINSQLKEMRITAPTESVVEILTVKVGDVLGPNQEVATLILPGHIWVRVYVPEPWLGHIKLGEKVQVRVDAFANKTLEGEVEQISRVAEFTPRNVQTTAERIKQVFAVKVRLNPKDDLRAGMAADIHFNGVPPTLK